MCCKYLKIRHTILAFKCMQFMKTLFTLFAISVVLTNMLLFPNIIDNVLYFALYMFTIEYY